MPYLTTDLESYLELPMRDGTFRGVCVVDEGARLQALAPGRSHLDRIGIEMGLLPRGSSLVSQPYVFPMALHGAADGGEPVFTAAAALGLSGRGDRIGRGYIMSEDDAEARRRHPKDARRYDALADALASEPGDSCHLAFALLADALRSDAAVSPDVNAIRIRCAFHAGRERDLYVYRGGSRYHCFSCGGGGDELDWLVRRHGLSASQAASILRSRT
ncbi:CHC2 zinc finger domain-containing protein [Sphingomonadaceae bacterium OTU29LAMAA1]|nr:CHC2 zinc finger domain-containing protein [Sphingomonadaceae bacterium OTU29LAMAA1]